jgi:hypothetical protein
VPAHHFEALTEVIALGLAIGLDLGLLPGFLQKEKATICFIQIILIIKKARRRCRLSQASGTGEACYRFCYPIAWDEAERGGTAAWL